MGEGKGAKKDQPYRVEEARRPSSQPRHAVAPDPPRVSSPRPRLSSDPEEKGKLNTREHQQKNHAQKCMVTPHTEPKHTSAKAKPKTKPNACAEHLRGRGIKRGKKNGTGKKSPQTQNLSTQTQEQSQAKQHIGPAPKPSGGDSAKGAQKT